MMINFARSLFTASVKHQLRETALAALTLTLMAAGNLKAQNCAVISYTVLPASWSYSWQGTANGSVTVNAPPGCYWTLIKEAYSGDFLDAFQFDWSPGRYGTVSGQGTVTVPYTLAPDKTGGVVQGNVHINGYGNYASARAQIVERSYLH